MTTPRRRLAHAAQEGKIEEVKQLFASESNDREKVLALQAAISNSHLDVVKYLIENKVSIESVLNGYTPLLRSLASNQFAIADYLITQGADISKVDPQGWTALMHAEERSNVYEAAKGIKQKLKVKGALGSGMLPYDQRLAELGFNLIKRFKIHVGGAVGLYEVDVKKLQANNKELYEAIKDLIDEKGRLILKSPVLRNIITYELKPSVEVKETGKIYINDVDVAAKEIKYEMINLDGALVTGVMPLPPDFPTTAAEIIAQQDKTLSVILDYTSKKNQTINEKQMRNIKEYYNTYQNEYKNVESLGASAQGATELRRPKLAAMKINDKEGDIDLIFNQFLSCNKEKDKSKDLDQHLSELGAAHRFAKAEEISESAEQIFDNLFSSMFDALSQVHNPSAPGKPYAHLDIACRNFMLNEDGESVKLIDFGLSLQIDPITGEVMNDPHFSRVPVSFYDQEAAKGFKSVYTDLFAFKMTMIEALYKYMGEGILVPSGCETLKGRAAYSDKAYMTAVLEYARETADRLRENGNARGEVVRQLVNKYEGYLLFLPDRPERIVNVENRNQQPVSATASTSTASSSVEGNEKKEENENIKNTIPTTEVEDKEKTFEKEEKEEEEEGVEDTFEPKDEEEEGVEDTFEPKDEEEEGMEDTFEPKDEEEEGVEDTFEPKDEEEEENIANLSVLERADYADRKAFSKVIKPVNQIKDENNIEDVKEKRIVIKYAHAKKIPAHHEEIAQTKSKSRPLGKARDMGTRAMIHAALQEEQQQGMEKQLLPVKARKAAYAIHQYLINHGIPETDALNLMSHLESKEFYSNYSIKKFFEVAKFHLDMDFEAGQLRSRDGSREADLIKILDKIEKEQIVYTPNFTTLENDAKRILGKIAPKGGREIKEQYNKFLKMMDSNKPDVSAWVVDLQHATLLVRNYIQDISKLNKEGGTNEQKRALRTQLSSDLAKCGEIGKFYDNEKILPGLSTNIVTKLITDPFKMDPRQVLPILRNMNLLARSANLYVAQEINLNPHSALKSIQEQLNQEDFDKARTLVSQPQLATAPKAPQTVVSPPPVAPAVSTTSSARRTPPARPQAPLPPTPLTQTQPTRQRSAVVHSRKPPTIQHTPSVKGVTSAWSRGTPTHPKQNKGERAQQHKTDQKSPRRGQS